MNRYFLRLVILIFPCVLMAASDSSRAQARLNKSLKQGHAIVWYLYHSGWAVKTQNHLLIFDYFTGGDTVKPAVPSLENGYINPVELKGQKVYVFTSHAHEDHYDSVILEWQNSVEHIKYIFGWKATDDRSHIHLEKERETLRIDDLEIVTIHHEFDGIPEAAFLVKVDGVTLYHAGDHGSSRGAKNPVFKGNVDFLASQARKVDFLFTPTWGGEFYTIEKLSPKVVFPMHDGSHEGQYKIFADKAKRRGVKAKVAVAEKRGDCFLNRKGKIKKLSK